MEMVLGMLFFTLHNADPQFKKKELTWKFYTAKEALPITRRVELIDKKKFAKASFDENIKAFVIHVNFLSLRSKMTIYLACKAQIVSLLAKKVTVPAKYSDFPDVFSRESAKMLLKCTGMNKHIIELEDGKQPPY